MRVNLVGSYGEQFNPDTIKSLKKLDDKIKEEMEKDEPSKEELLKIEQAKMMEGLKISGGYGFNNYRRNIPW